MRISNQSLTQVASDLRDKGLRFEVGPFLIQFSSSIAQIANIFYTMYGDFRTSNGVTIADFHIHLRQPKNIRRWIRRQALFLVDGGRPFAPFPHQQVFPLFEWGLNWCIATRSHQYLMLNAAVVEKNGSAVLLPAWPGSGKSTLCAALVCSGWRLLSDEFGLTRPLDNQMLPLPRCIPLKNESIEVIRTFAPDAVLGPTFYGTRKGDVAHLKPPRESVERAGESATAAFVVFPNYDPTESCSLTAMPKSRSFMKLAENSFNYELLGEAGFRTVGTIIESTQSYLLNYSNLDKAVSTLNKLVE